MTANEEYLTISLAVGDELIINGLRFTVTAITDFGEPCLTAQAVYPPHEQFRLRKLVSSTTVTA